MKYTIKNVKGHIEVYDHNNKFILSADNLSEAREEIAKMK